MRRAGLPCPFVCGRAGGRWTPNGQRRRRPEHADAAMLPPRTLPHSQLIHAIINTIDGSTHITITPHPTCSHPPEPEQKAGGKAKGGKKPTVKYTIDCFQPVDDKVLDMATFEKFLKDRIKVRFSADTAGWGVLGCWVCVWVWLGVEGI